MVPQSVIRRSRDIPLRHDVLPRLALATIHDRRGTDRVRCRYSGGQYRLFALAGTSEDRGWISIDGCTENPENYPLMWTVNDIKDWLQIATMLVTLPSGALAMTVSAIRLCQIHKLHKEAAKVMDLGD
jgi:hypothetical protein